MKIKSNLIPEVFLFIALLFFANFASAGEKYSLDSQHSYVLWHVNHFGFSNPSGKWFVEGELDLDNKKPENSKINVTINTAAINTGIAELDKHLKDKLFFDVKQFPTASFKSTKVNLTGKDTAKVEGDLTLHGVTKIVVLAVKLNKMGLNPISNKTSVGFSATTQLKRSEFGINAYLPGLSDEVKIEIEVEAFQKQVK